MILDRALLENVERSTKDVARVVAEYRKSLVDGGMPEPEAWTLAIRLEERLLGPVFQQAEAQLAPAPWVDVEALFVTIVNLQLFLGQRPDACSAVKYMATCGVRLRPLTGSEANRLGARTTIDPHAVAAAFSLHRQA
jgi:hypothetical protein